MKQNEHGSSWKPACLFAAVLCAAAVLACGPPALAEAIRVAVRDALSPGQRLLQQADAALQSLPWPGSSAERDEQDDEAAALRSELAAWKARCRHLEIEAALRREAGDDADAYGVPPTRAAAGRPLVVPELLEARVLGEESAARWRSGRLLDRGAADGVGESALVLEDLRPLIDQGADAGLESGQPVYSARCVAGRVATVGRWTSTLRPVTDREYRGLAQLVRQTEHGPMFGAQGILEGTGEPLCRLRSIGALEAVHVGDDVYTGQRDGLLPYPMYYGKVVRAELPEGAPHWEIEVEPAVRDITARTVQVLRKRLNPLRETAE